MIMINILKCAYTMMINKIDPDHLHRGAQHAHADADHDHDALSLCI